MASSDMWSFDPEEVADDVKGYCRRHGVDNRSKAIRQLIRIGARETRRPWLYRVREQMMDIALHLGALGLAVVLIGAATPLLTPGTGATIGLVLAAVGIGLVATVELLKVVAARAAPGRLREVISFE